MHPVRVSIPSFRSENNSIEKGYTVFKIDVLMNGRQHSVEKRYSEFHTLHKMDRCSNADDLVPSQPSISRIVMETIMALTAPHTVTRFIGFLTTLPVIRQTQTQFMQIAGFTGALKKSIKPPEIPSKHVRNWVPKVLEQRRHGLELYLQTIIMENGVLPKIFLDFLNIRHFPSVPKTESCGSFDTESEESSKLSHQPVLLFLRDPYLLPSAHDTFSNVVIEGVIHGVFYPDLQPRKFVDQVDIEIRGRSKYGRP